MAKSNRDRVAEVMDLLKAGLAPYVVREYIQAFGKRVIEEINSALTSGVYGGLASVTVEGAVKEMDTQACLNLMQRRWDQVFKTKLGKSERGYVNELSDVRNAWAHQKAFTNDDAYRCADTAARLLEAINAPKEAQTAKEIAAELLRLRFDAEQKQSTKAVTGSLAEAPTTTKAGLKPWRLVVQPHKDVASGRYTQAEFAADLAQVVSGRADPEYNDPREFFRRTYLTEGLVDLLVNGLKRLTGSGGDPVVQLQTSFGGGKTHSMLALYHLFGGQIGLSGIPGGEAIAKRVPDAEDTLTTSRAVIVGTAFDAAHPRQYKDCTTHTIWGDIAYQLGGTDGYKMVEQADLNGVSPGSDTLLALLEKFGPALIIVDELVAFARNLYGITNRLAAGSFDAVMTFMQSLTEAVKRSSDSLLLVSIPASDMEIGGEGGVAALDILAKTIGRIESVWKPVTATEAYEIVRRRLFNSEMDYAARDAVLTSFREMYAQNSADFPSGVAEADYMRRMKDAYPIHPELFDRLYEDWSTLDRFQRTRGVLRFMSAVIHRLWTDNDQSLLIMPGSIPLWNSVVRNELSRYLPDNWSAILDSDIDGEHSRPYQIDKAIPQQGQYTASRRVARALFMGSAPSVAAQNVRGVEEVRVRLAVVQPGEPVAVFGDALKRLSNELTYLYRDSSRYWYDTRPTVNRIAEDRAQNIHDDLVYQEAIRRLRAVKSRKEDFNAAHVAPQDSGDVADEARARIVVLSPEFAHRKNPDGTSDALDHARAILENRGGAPRLYRNMLIFVAPDANNAEAWEKSIREYLAWRSIDDETEQLNLDAQQRKQVAARLKTADDTVASRLQETYSWLIVPVQPEPTGRVELQTFRISGEDSFYDRAARKLRQGEQLIPRWAPHNLVMELDNYLWRDEPHLSLKQLWEYLARYCYLPRLYNEEVLIGAVQDGVNRDDAPFAYASLVKSDRTYSGLIFRKPGSVFFDGNSVLVRADVAQRQIDEELRRKHALEEAANNAERPPGQSFTPSPTSATSSAVSTPYTPPAPQIPTRFHGTVSIDPHRTNREVGMIVDEIIQRLAGLTGTDVKITLEISAHREDGFDEATQRTINENSRTLKFRSQGFESE